MRFSTVVCALTGVMGLLAPVIASPMPASARTLSRLNIPRTSLTERALVDLDLCIQLEVNIDLTDILIGLRDQVITLNPAPPSGGGLGGLIGGVVGGVVGTVGNLVGGLVGTVAEVLKGLETLIGLDVRADLGSLCLCLSGGVLTPESLATVTSSIGSAQAANRGLLGDVAKLVPNLLDLIAPLLAPLIDTQSDRATQCPSFPEGSTPLPTGETCGSSCLFTCPTGFQPCGRECIDEAATCCTDGQKDCGGGVCVPNSDLCPSSTVNRMSIRARSRYACRQPLTACPVSHFLARDGSSVAGRGFECLDTRANIESCGGCITPFKGNTAGQDCTAIAHADGVACAAGTCIVESCIEGFVPSADASACQVSSSKAVQRSLKSRQSRN